MMRWSTTLAAFLLLLAPEDAAAQSAASKSSDSSWTSVQLVEGLPDFGPLKRQQLTNARQAPVQSKVSGSEVTFVWAFEPDGAPVYWILVRRVDRSQSSLSKSGLKPERGGGLRASQEVELNAGGSSERTPLELRLVPETGTLHYRWGTAPPSLLRKGAPAPDFEVKRLAGGKETLSKLRGKVVVINSWAIWCAPCVEEIPGLNRLVEKYGQREDVVFLAISPDTAGDLKAFFKRRPFLYEQALANRETKKLFKESYPRHVILDRDGKIVYDCIGGSKTVDKELEKALVALLGPV